MAVSDDQDNASLTLAQLRALRRENTGILGQVVGLFENQDRLQTAVLSPQEGARDACRSVRSDINGLRSDVLLLEGRNASRHGEILNIMRRLDDPDAA